MAHGEGLSGAARRDDGVFPIYAEHVVVEAEEIDYESADINAQDYYSGMMLYVLIQTKEFKCNGINRS